MVTVFYNVATYIFVNLALFFSWYALLFRKRKSLLFVDRIIAAFILGLTQIVSTEMILGIVFKKLHSTPLFLFNLFISFCVLLLALPGDRRNKGIYSEIREETIRIARIIKDDYVLFCIFGLFFISICWMIFLGYLFPSYTWDALWYHLPIVGYIMQSGAIQENPTPSMIDLFINIFPKNIELFFLWNTIFLKSNIISDLSQLLFTMVGVLTIYSINIKLKIKEKYALYSSIMFFFTPIIILQSTTNYIDVAISVLFLICINFLVYDNPENSTGSKKDLIHFRDRRIPIFLLGITSGILLGSKGSGPLFFIILSSLIVIRELIRYFNPSRIFSGFSSEIMPSKCKRSLLKDSFKPYMVYFILPSFLIGGYWYIKNWLLYNNPVYPMEISLFNTTVFKGLYGGIIDPAPDVIGNLSPLLRPFYTWLEKVRYYIYDSRLSGFGPIWFILFLPSLVFSFIYGVKRKKYNFLFISLILIVTFILYPRNWNTRYVIFFVGLGALSFGMIFDYFNRREKVLKTFVLLLVIYSFLASNSPCIVPEKVREFILLPPQERTLARQAPFNIDLQARQEYGYWIWISNNISKGDILAYTFEPLFLSPLWNRDFSNKIVYIKSDTYSEWLKELKKNDVTHVLIRTNSAEDKWINKERRLLADYRWLFAFKERFKVVYSDENYKILKRQKAK